MLINDFKLPKWFINSTIGDWVLYMITIKDRKIKKLEDELAVYRIHGGSIWSSYSEATRLKNSIKSFKLLLRSQDYSPEVLNILKLEVGKYETMLSKKNNLFSVFLKRIKGVFYE